MCGILGYWNLKDRQISDQVFDEYVDSLSHRGHGSRGVWRDAKSGLSLGHRRLAIFDLSDRGAQPMSYGNGRYWITFNGEIFNYLEIQAELKQLGHSFKSTCDTEVILAAYAQWGEKCLLRFNGAFAFAIWDAVAKTLWAARDHFGIKPFHYIVTDDYVAFASEMKSFLKLPHFKVDFDEALVAETIANVNGLEGTEHCLLKGVKRLQAGFSMIVTPDGNITKKQWWRTIDHIPKDIPSNEAEQIERFRSLFEDACRLRLRSDLPIVATLSGGLDSSSVTAMTASLLHEEGAVNHFERAFVASFPGTNQEETQYARAVAQQYNLPLTVREIDLDEDMMSMIDDMIWFYEDIYWILPVGSWRIYKDIGSQKQGGIVALDGSGGDDMLASQYFMIQEDMGAALARLDWARFRELQNILIGMSGGSIDRIPSGLGDVVRLKLINSPFMQKALPVLSKLFSIPPRSFLRKQPTKLQLYYPYQFRKPASFTALQHSQYVWTHFTGMPTVNRTYDRGPAAHGISLRAPLLDWRLVTFSLGLSDNMKVGHGYAKYILRQAMAGLMPENVRLRTDKVGFTSPMDRWFAGPLNTWLQDTITDKDFLASAIWDGPAVAAYVRQSMAEKRWTAISPLWPIFHAFHTMRIFQQGGPKKVAA